MTVKADDVDRLVDDREHEAELTGTVTAPALSPTPLKVEGGRFNLLVRDEEHAAARQMLYSMPLVADDGRRFFFEGYKQIIDDDGLDLWKDTTTLYVTVHEGDREGPVTAKGIVTIHLADFAKQMTTMKVDRRRRPARPARRAGEVRPDVRRLAQRDLRRRVRQRPNAFNPDAPPREHRPLRTPPGRRPLLQDRRRRRAAPDPLQRRPQGPGDPRRPASARPPSPTPSTPPTRTCPEYLFEHGYDVWVLDYRASPVLPSALHAVHARRHRPVRLPGRGRQGARGLGRRVRAGDGALRRVDDPPDGAGPRACRACATPSSLGS